LSSSVDSAKIAARVHAARAHIERRRVMRRFLVTMLAALGLAAAGAGAATAAPQDDAQAAADAFLKALDAGNAEATCALMTGRLQATLSQGQTCVQLLTGDDPAVAQDSQAASLLIDAWLAAQLARLNEPGALYPTPGRRLAAGIRSRLRGTRVIVGAGVNAARNQAGTTVVVDGRLSTKRRIVLYAESDSGTIVRLTAGLKGNPAVTRGGRGVPATVVPDAPATFAFDSVSLVSAEEAIASVTITDEGSSSRVLLRLRLESTGWKVDDLYTSLFELLAALAGSPE
jgi:hypothetical protein